MKTQRNMNTLLKTIFCLPMLALLITAAVAGPAHAEDFSGTIGGNENFVPTGGNRFVVDGSGAGTSTQLNIVSGTWDFIGNFQTGVARGTRRFVAANGDVLVTHGSGQGTPPDENGDQNVVEEHKITSGTGQFRGASGSLRVVRIANIFSGNTSGTFSGTINLKK